MNGWWLIPAIAFSAVVWGSLAFGEVIRDDPGGNVDDRLVTIEVLRQSGERVEIAGWCASSCTLYLALPNACVRKSARLGFHGPQSQFYGVGLPPAEFERVSRVMASHYPAPLRAWFIATARHEIMGVVKITGRQAIQMGAREC